MARPGDVIPTFISGYVFIVADVDDNGEPTGGYAVPSFCKDMIADLVAFIKEGPDPEAVIREAERIIQDARFLGNHKG